MCAPLCQISSCVLAAAVGLLCLSLSAAYMNHTAACSHGTEHLETQSALVISNPCACCRHENGTPAKDSQRQGTHLTIVRQGCRACSARVHMQCSIVHKRLLKFVTDQVKYSRSRKGWNVTV
jgi:hypothetical protein